MNRKTELRRSRMKPARRKAVPGRKEAAEAFRDAVLQEPCLACGSWGPRDAHHAIPAQALRRICATLGMTDVEALAIVYAPAVGVALCSAMTGGRCHERHTMAFARIPGHLLPERVYAFASDLGPEAVAALEREHPGARVAPDGEEDAWTS